MAWSMAARFGARQVVMRHPVGYDVRRRFTGEQSPAHSGSGLRGRRPRSCLAKDCCSSQSASAVTSCQLQALQRDLCRGPHGVAVLRPPNLKKTAHAAEQERPAIVTARRLQPDLDPRRCSSDGPVSNRFAARSRAPTPCRAGHMALKTTTFDAPVYAGLTAPMLPDGPMNGVGPSLMRAGSRRSAPLAG